ncbi:protein kinase [Nocardiopsis sp. SBT366]|uniref:protein kinase domain-containing protein n=1 Tax=Nocardiopsis sp. SBT366 TaxID=1580529 RepID=UPI000A6F82F7|nr:protein kinase [Nocardiopsis sp. SBT366]
MAMSAGFPTGEELPERIGHYVIRRRIGAGGMGVVYQAEDPRTDQFVAVKVLKPEVAGDHIARARLAREVETMRRVQSPNVAEVIDADTQAELPWVVTEYIPGPTLDATVTDHGPLRGRALTRFITGMARAIKDIHAVDVIHRDLKPGNVIISNGEPIVIDFGIAHAVDGAKLTQTGTFVGTPSYLSPEVIEGTDLGPATDVHAWGGTVAFASTGRPPYGAGSFEVIFFRILNGEIDMDGMHEALRPLVNRAVSRDMSARPTAAELMVETGRLNLDLPWTEPGGGMPPTGQTGSHTMHAPTPTQNPAASGGHGGGSGFGGAAAAGAAGAALGGAAGYLAGRATDGWGPAHTRGANPANTAGAWANPSAPQTSHARSGGWNDDATDDLSGGRPANTGSGWNTDDEATNDLNAARSTGWGSDAEATDDLGGRRAAATGWGQPDEATDDLSNLPGTDRITPGSSHDLDDPQGTERMQPGQGDMHGTQRFEPGELARRDDAHGTQRFEPGELARRDDPAGTMMMGQAEIARQQAQPDAAPQTQFFNSPLDPNAFQDILTPVGQQGRANSTQEFDEEEFEERGGLLGRFRRGRGDKFGDYFRGDGHGDEYDEHEDDEYYDEYWRMHPLVLVPIMVSLAGVALWFPWVGIILGIVVIAGLGALDVVKSEHARRLQTRGPRNSDSMVVALSFPWAFGRMALRTVGFGLIYLLGGILVGMVYARIMDAPGEGANYTGAFAVFVMILLSYLMPSGREARHQAVWLVERARFSNLYVYVGVVVAILLLTMLILSIGLTSAPIWTTGPLSGPSDWFG